MTRPPRQARSTQEQGEARRQGPFGAHAPPPDQSQPQDQGQPQNQTPPHQQTPAQAHAKQPGEGQLQADALQQWLALLQADATRLGALVQQAVLDKAERQTVRALLWRVYAAVEAATPATADDDGDLTAEARPEPPTPAAPPGLHRAAAVALLRELEGWLRRLGDDRGAGAKRLRDVRVQKPLADRVRLPPSARQTQHLAAAVDGHFRTRLALTDERLAWFEARVAPAAPTSVATIKPPAETDTERLDLELLRKAGRTKFS
jgi:hypothetical protein